MQRVKVKAAVDLLQYVWPDFIDVEGAVLLRVEHAKSSGRLPEMDLTSWEAFVNHVHILDIVSHKADRTPAGDDDAFWDAKHPDFAAACEIGKRIASIWFTKLQHDFPGYRFRVYYTEDDNPIVRFHRAREGEPFWLSEEQNQGAIAQGRVLVLDTGQQQ